MNLTQMIARLERYPAVLAALVDGISDEEARYKPPTGAWSILEIITHLADEETEDFPLRMQMTLEDPDQSWPSIGPEGAAVERKYNEGDLAEALARFTNKRRGWLDWISAQSELPWDISYEHQFVGTLRAGDLFAAWVAHDSLHLAQISKRLVELTRLDAGDYHTKYAEA